MINTTLCYIEKNESYLMIHRVKKEKDYNKDKWIGIGGKFEEGESPEECIRREVMEETGLELNRLEYRGIVTFCSTNKGESYNEFMHLFWGEPIGKALEKLKECDEGTLEWIPKSHINDIPHWKGDEIFLKLIDERTPFFSLKLVYKDGELLRAVLNERDVL